MLNFDKAYDQMGRMMKAGTLGGQIFQMDLANDGWTLTKPFQRVAPEVETQVFGVIGKLAKGEIKLEN